VWVIALGAAPLITALALCAERIAPQETDFDLLIRGGRIVDGTGAPWFSADIGIRSGRIAAIGRLSQARGARLLDAAGYVVTPGFVDMMGQTAAPFLNDSSAAFNLITQGITTINCREGSSSAPLSEPAAREGGW